MSLHNIDKLVEDTWGFSDMAKKAKASQPQPGDNARLIWFAEGRWHHAHTKWQNLPMVHAEIWSWRTMEPEEVWAYHMRLKGYCLSKHDTQKGNTHLTAMLVKEDGTTDVPKEVELYNALLGE